MRLLAPIRFRSLAGADPADELYRSVAGGAKRLLADVADQVVEKASLRRDAEKPPEQWIAPGFLYPVAQRLGEALCAADMGARLRVVRQAERTRKGYRLSVVGYRGTENRKPKTENPSFMEFADFPAPSQAIEVLLRKQLMPWSEIRDQFADYQQRAFWIARVEEVRILGAVRDEVAKQMIEGIDRRAFVQAVQQGITGDLTIAHLNTVLRTNLQSCYNGGHWEMLQHPEVEELFPYYQYVTAEDDRVRPEHAAMDRKIFRRDDPIWLVWWPPNGYNCRCTVVALDAEAAQEMGVTGSDRWPQVNPSAGLVQPDPGFAGLPSQFDWKSAAIKAEAAAAS